MSGTPFPRTRAYTASLLCVVCTECCVTQGHPPREHLEVVCIFLKRKIEQCRTCVVMGKMLHLYVVTVRAYGLRARFLEREGDKSNGCGAKFLGSRANRFAHFDRCSSWNFGWIWLRKIWDFCTVFTPSRHRCTLPYLLGFLLSLAFLWFSRKYNHRDDFGSTWGIFIV